MIFYTEKEMENIDLLKELLDAGFTAIKENGVVVEKAESTDDILIENLIAELEEE